MGLLVETFEEALLLASSCEAGLGFRSTQPRASVDATTLRRAIQISEPELNQNGYGSRYDI